MLIYSILCSAHSIPATGCAKLFDCLRDPNKMSLHDRLKQLKHPQSWWYLVIMHSLAVGILVIYAICMYFKMDDGPYVGIVVACSAAALDGYFLLFRWVGLLKKDNLSLWMGAIGECAECQHNKCDGCDGGQRELH